MESEAPKRLVVTDHTGDHYIPLNHLVCILAHKYSCTIYHVNAERKLHTLTGSRTMLYYAKQLEGRLMPVHRNACVNPNYVSKLLTSRIVKFSVADMPRVVASTRLYPKVRAALRSRYL